MSEQLSSLTAAASSIDWEATKETGSWDRAVANAQDAYIDSETGGLGQQLVRLNDTGNEHRTVLVKAPDGEYAGACDCDGFAFNGTACAHLCVLRALESLDAFEIKTSGSFVEELKQTGSQDEESDDSDSEQHPQPPEEMEPVGDTAPQPRRKDAFAEPLPDVDQQYVMEMGNETYIRRAGYARLGYEKGYRPIPNVIRHEWEGDKQQVVVQGTVQNEDGELVASDYGVAGPPEYEDMDGAEHNLLELATTRALTRAMAWATGEGLTAVEEIPGGPDG